MALLTVAGRQVVLYLGPVTNLRLERTGRLVLHRAPEGFTLRDLKAGAKWGRIMYESEGATPPQKG
jgi:hypothetical protein